ncbi:class A beta-lactamase [Pseudomonas sp. HLMP]|uniref:class A beta-lactamase n=1 Tax=Pseudomonas TaxID=286 RepID=UPI003967614C
MKPTFSRRQLIQGAMGGSVMLATPAWASDPVHQRLQHLEQALGGTLGLWALDTGSGRRLSYRSEARAALCSTFKVVLAAAILQQDQAEPGLLERRIAYTAEQLVVYSPVTEKHVATGMSVAELCAAALQYSDNTAANLLLGVVGGPSKLTAYARSIGDPAFRLDRYEPALNSALPNDPRDTSTPLAMGVTLQRLLLTDGLPAAARLRLQDWLKGNTTGDTRIRAGLPEGWVVGDKTGSGDYGVANDVGIIWPPGQAPWILAIYTRGRDKTSPWRSDVIAEATRVVVEAWKV